MTIIATHTGVPPDESTGERIEKRCHATAAPSRRHKTTGSQLRLQVTSRGRGSAAESGDFGSWIFDIGFQPAVVSPGSKIQHPRSATASSLWPVRLFALSALFNPHKPAKGSSSGTAVYPQLAVFLWTIPKSKIQNPISAIEDRSPPCSPTSSPNATPVPP